VSNYPSYLGSPYNAASTSGGPNILGGGQYQGAPININGAAFNNPLAGTAVPAGNAEIQNYLGNAAGGVNAANSPYTGQAGAGLGSLAAQYQALANGQGPSAATVAAQQQGASNLQAAESMLGSARGAGNPAAAQLAARNAQTQGGQQVAANVVAGRTAEELGALGGLGSTYGALGQLGTAVQGQQNAIAQGNQANALAANTNYLGALTGIAGQQQQGQIGGQNLYANTALGQQQVANSAYQNAANNNNKIAGQVLGAAGNAAGSLFGI
jgi:hypothetical protein